jgi:N-acyl-D-aspartate/D-glutamate deacylase
MVSNCGPGQNRQLSGLTVGAIAKGWGLTPEEGVRRLLVEENGLVGAIFFSMSEEDVTLIMADSLVAVGSDGHGLDAAADGGETTHPRSYGTFPRILGRYVRESKVLSLETAIRKMTSLPASRLGFTDRGLIRPGFVADLVLFDPATIKDLASYRDPHHYAQGVVHLLVGGELVIHEGKLTGRRPGRVLRKV